MAHNEKPGIATKLTAIAAIAAGATGANGQVQSQMLEVDVADESTVYPREQPKVKINPDGSVMPGPNQQLLRRLLEMTEPSPLEAAREEGRKEGVEEGKSKGRWQGFAGGLVVAGGAVAALRRRKKPDEPQR